MWGKARSRDVCCALLALWVWLQPASAQLTVGENTNLNLTGNISAGYTGAYSNLGSSDHGLTLGGDATLSGSYYSPGFLSFSIEPYYNRSQANSSFQSITDTSGINASASIFGGSHFPGAITFNKAYDSTGQFGVPGIASFETQGNSQAFSIGWSALVPDWPTLAASLTLGSGASTIYGADEESSTSTRIFSLRSTYLLKGFRLAAGFLHQSNDATFPGFLIGGQEQNSSTGSNQYQISATHSFPMQGAYSVAFSRVGYSYEYDNGASGAGGTHGGSGTSDTLAANLTFHPTQKVSLAFSSNYNDNLAGSITNELISIGGVIPQSNLGTSRSLLNSADAFVTLRSNLFAQAGISRQDQYFWGQDYHATLFNGSLSYNLTRRFLGSLSFHVGMVDTASQEGNTGLGLVGGVNFARRMRGFDVAASFYYGQNVQTLLAVYTSSMYNYTGSVSRKLTDRVRWIGSYSGSHSGFTAVPGSGNSSERISTSFSCRRYAINGYYSTSAGTSFLTATGLVPTPGPLPPPVVVPGNVILFNGTAYGGGASASPLRRLTISGAYAKGSGSTISPTVASRNDTTLVNGLLQYQFRKLYLTAGFTRFNQSIGAAGVPPSMVNSYYFGISRWFSVF